LQGSLPQAEEDRAVDLLDALLVAQVAGGGELYERRARLRVTGEAAERGVEGVLRGPLRRAPARARGRLAASSNGITFSCQSEPTAEGRSRALL
jgi:hypothetical protein